MPTLIVGLVAVVVLYSLLQMFRAANPAVLARAIKIAGGIVTLAVAAFLLGAFVAALIGTVFAVGDRLRREAEGLV